MRPGSDERIQHYRKLAEQEIDLFESMPEGFDSIPILPPKFERVRKLKEMIGETMPTIDQAIEILTSEEAPKQIEERIEALESELDKLKKFHRALTGSSASKSKGDRQRVMKIDADVEQSIVDIIKKHGPQRPKDLGEMLEISYMTIGKIARASERLTNERGMVELAL